MADSGLIKAVTSDVKAIAVDGAERLLQVGDTVSLNETIITENAGTVSIWLSDGTKLGLEENTNTLLDESYFNQGLETIKDPVVSSAEDEVAAIQQALVDDQSFDPSKLEAPAAGGNSLVGEGDFVDSEGYSAVSIDYLNPAMTPESGFNTRGINNGDSLVLDLTSGELILEPVFINSLVPPSSITPGNGGAGSNLDTAIETVVQVTDHNGIEAGDNAVVEGSTLAITGNFVVEASEGVASIRVAGIDISVADLLDSATTPIDFATDEGGVLSVDGYNESTGTVDYSYLPASGAKDHSAGDESIVDQFEITVTDVNGQTSNTAILDILIKDTVPQAFDNNEKLSQNQEWLVDGVINNVQSTDDNAADDVIGADGAKLQAVTYDGTTLDFTLNATDLISNSNGDFFQFTTDNGTLYIRDDGDYWYQNTTVGGNAEVTDTFSYQIIDGDGDLSSANLTITQVLGDINTGDLGV